MKLWGSARSRLRERISPPRHFLESFALQPSIIADSDFPSQSEIFASPALFALNFRFQVTSSSLVSALRLVGSAQLLF